MGATGRDIVQLVLQQGLRIAALGLACGLALMLSGADVLDRFLYDVSSNVIAPHLGVASVLTFLTLAACVIPGCRAASVDPIAALRVE